MNPQYAEVIDLFDQPHLVDLSNVTHIEKDEDGYAVFYFRDGKHLSTLTPYGVIKQGACSLDCTRAQEGR